MLNSKGRCVPCQKVKDSDGEIPVEVVMKLLSMAETRHPTVSHEDAPRFRQVLEQEGIVPASPNRNA